MKQDIHVFQGMRRDNHPIRQESKYLWEAHNIRFTARDDNTLLSMTNERGTKPTGVTFKGQYVGHCVLGDYLVVFTRDIDINKKHVNYIYRASKTNDEWNSTEVYSGILNMEPTHPAQTLGIYESELVQKVYWVDGVNQPRSINIVADKLFNKDLTKDREELYPEGCFNFTQELQLNEKVTVEREEGGGSFSPGTIQYAFSYYNKYGQESNLFYTTELFNTSFVDRGGSPEDAVTNAFHITIEGIETKFQYLRVYSIHRTSINSTPTVKLVTDIDITGNSTIVTYIDTGLTGTDIDPAKMLYIGGESIVAGTIAEKDNTLFLGNIELKRQAIPESIKTNLKNYSDNDITIGTRAIKLKTVEDSSAVYEYSNQLSTGNTASFKVGDTYRLGVQFQHKSGKWSEPCWIRDYTIPRTVKPYRADGYNNVKGDYIIVPSMSFKLDNDTITELRALEYKKARSLVVLPTIYDRMVLAQGVLCPTVFCVKDRVSNTPFAQSSWFFRPISKEAINNSSNIEKGATVAFKHLDPLLSGSDRGAEIQNMVTTDFKTANTAAKKDKATNNNAFFVDQSIITMHSPDIEFDDSTKQALEGNDFELDIVGLAQFKTSAGDITIQTSTAVPAPNDNGFFHKSFLTTNYENKGIVAGMFYKSHLIDDKDNGKTIYAYNAKDPKWELNWLVYPWQRSGSLNNDIARPEGTGTRTSVLKRKIISNIRFSPDILWLNNIWSSEGTSASSLKNGITPVSIFDSNEVSLIKIPIPKNSGIQALNYYGNVDTLITTDSAYTFYVTPNAGEGLQSSGAITNPFTKVPLQSIKDSYTSGLTGDYAEQLKEVKEPVRMKYKSTAHAVFAFNYLDNRSPVILPKVNLSINAYNGANIVPFWSNVKDDTPSYDNAKDAEIQDVRPLSYIGNSSAIESYILKELRGLYGPREAGVYAIYTCSAQADDISYADLYVSTGIGSDPWKKVTLGVSNLNELYKYKANDTYWQVIKDDDFGYCLTRVGSSSVYSIKQDTILNDGNPGAFLFIAELKRKNKPVNRFGGDTDEALRNNLWIPAGAPSDLNEPIEVIYGDTYYQRYDCLKTYSFTNEDENSVVEIASFMCETRTNLDGRYDRNRGQLSNLNMSPTNFNLINPVYSQRDNFFNYRILDNQYYRNTKYPSQVLWSMEKSYLEDVDTWANVTLANSIDLSGSAGPITSIETFNDLLIAFQEKSISQILFNSRVQIPTSDGTPVEISNSYKVDGARPISDAVGCQSKWSIAKSPSGLYFVDNTTDTLYLYNGQLQDLSTQLGGRYWMRENHSGNGSFIRLSYDPKNKDLYLSPQAKDSLCYSEQLGQFTSLMSYKDVIMLPMNNDFFSLQYKESQTRLWENFKGDYNSFYDEIILPSFTYICNEDPTYTKIFDTIEYRADVFDADGGIVYNKTFDWVRATNEYQDSGVKEFSQLRGALKDISLRKSFRVWRGQIPRQGRERIRNPWAAISLGFNQSEITDANKFHFILHDISTKYTV